MCDGVTDLPGRGGIRVPAPGLAHAWSMDLQCVLTGNTEILSLSNGSHYGDLGS